MLDQKTLVGVGLRGALGPVSFAVDGLGMTLDLRFAPGNAGPFGLRVGLQPPTGLGLAIEAGPVSGGGVIAYRADGAEKIAVTTGLTGVAWPTEVVTGKIVVLGLDGDAAKP